MTDYTKLTEKEINEAVAVKLGLVIQEAIKRNQQEVRILDCEYFLKTFDPCNNPTDWAPLLEELRQLGEVSISNASVRFREYPENGKRCILAQADKLGEGICILWLMVKGE